MTASFFQSRRTMRRIILWGVCLVFGFGGVTHAYAATLRLSPDTGVYTAGATFSARIVVNTQGQSINAAEGSVSFNTADLSVVSVSKAGSIFNLWTREPEFSNANGKVTFGGGSPSGYTGSAGTVATITFRTKHAGTTNVSFSEGSVLAADGKGTNVISGMQGAAYTVQAASEVPQPEYVPPANTPGLPVITSSTHADQKEWYVLTTARLAWKLPSGVTALRTLLDTKESSIPTKVYDSPISEITLEDLPQGASYFHVQFKNADGWGRVAHYRLGVDSEKPTSFTIAPAEHNDQANPAQVFVFDVEDATSGVDEFSIQIDGGEKSTFTDAEKSRLYTTPTLSPGMHTILVEAFDGARNSIVASYDFTVTAFDKPVFTEYPRELPSSVIPVIKGTTRPDATVAVTLQKIGTAERVYEIRADATGVFAFIPEGRLENGVYELFAVAKDAHGSQSERSDTIRIAVQEPGFVRVFGMLVSILSVVVPLLGLVLLLALLSWYGWHHARYLRSRIRTEVGEAEQSLAHEFDGIVSGLQTSLSELRLARKGRMTKQEQDILMTLENTIEGARRRVKKEIDDIEKLVKR